MLVPLTADEGSNRAWAMIEMQGELERKDGGTLDEAFDVGTLSVSSTVSAWRGSSGAVAEGPASQRHTQLVLLEVGMLTSARSASAADWQAKSSAGHLAVPLPGSLTLPLLPVLAHLPQGSVLLTIGYHQLEGKRMELKKPFAVLDRVAGSGSGSSEEGQESTQYKVRQHVGVAAAAAVWH